MRQVKIIRLESDDSGTFGILTTDDGFSCWTLERPWRDNLTGKSCIPAGTYKVNKRDSPKHGRCYHVDGVKDRTDIEIHAANWAGDESKGLKCQLLGCIAPGRAIGELVKQKAILSSRDALEGFETEMEGADFELTLSWDFGVGPICATEKKS